MKRWGIYAMGILTGCGAFALVQRWAPTAEAEIPRAAAVRAADGSTTLAVVGGSEANRRDILWVIRTEPVSAEIAKKLVGEPTQRVTICAYHAPTGSGSPVDLDLRAARNATADFLLLEHKGSSLSVAGAVKKLKEQLGIR